MYSFDTRQAAGRQQRFWNTVAEAWRSHQEELELWMEPVTRAMTDRLGNYPRRVLDVGCGARPMPLPSEWRAFGVDSASQMVTGRNVVQGSFQELPFQGATFDAVVSRFALMLADDAVAALREANRVTRLGGSITLAVWDAAEKNSWVSGAETILMSSLGIREPAPTEPSAYRLAGKAEAVAMIAGAGYRVVSTESVLLPYFQTIGPRETFEFLVRFIGPIRTMVDKLPPENREQVCEAAMSALDGVSRSGTAWVHHAIREPRIL